MDDLGASLRISYFRVYIFVFLVSHREGRNTDATAPSSAAHNVAAPADSSYFTPRLPAPARAEYQSYTAPRRSLDPVNNLISSQTRQRTGFTVPFAAAAGIATPADGSPPTLTGVSRTEHQHSPTARHPVQAIVVELLAALVAVLPPTPLPSFPFS